MPSCVVPTCRNTTCLKKKQEGITFHVFPSSQIRKSQWTKIIQKARLDDFWKPLKRSVVCSVHFEEKYFYNTKCGFKRLQEGAFPNKNIIIDGDELTSLMALSADTKLENVTLEDNDAINTEYNSDEYGTDVSENSKSDTARKRTLATTEEQNSKKPRHDFDDIIIDYNNVDKFGEQIASLLKKIPRQLCRELQDSIVTIVKTATKKYLTKSKRDDVPSTSSNVNVDDILSQIVLTPTLVTKPIVNEGVTIKVEPIDNAIEDETTFIERQHMETQIGANLSISKSKICHSAMTVPIEFVGSLDCVKQEPLDPGETNDDTAQEYNEDNATNIDKFDPLNSDTKTNIVETDFIKEASSKSIL